MKVDWENKISLLKLPNKARHPVKQKLRTKKKKKELPFLQAKISSCLQTRSILILKSKEQLRENNQNQQNSYEKKKTFLG